MEVVYADVEELSDKLNEIFNSQTQSQGTARVQRTGNAAPTPPIPTSTTNPGAAADTGTGGGTSGEETPINIIPQPRTSKIFLMGRPADIVFVEGLIESFDAPSSKRNFLRRKLAYLPVGEFIPVAADALERTLETGTGGQGGGARRTSSATGRNVGFNNTRTQQVQRNQTGGSLGQVGSGASRAQIQQQELQTAPESILIGKTLLVGDNISNSIVVNGPPHHIEIVEELVKELDQPSEQVAITAVFARYDVSKGRSFGIDLVHLLDNVTDDAQAGFQSRNNTPGVVEPDLLDDFANMITSGGGNPSANRAECLRIFSVTTLGSS